MTTEKEPLSELEKIKKKTKNTEIATLFLALVGLMIFVAGMILIISWVNVMDDNHLQNPGMPLNQYPQNATYIWTHHDILKQIYDLIPVAGAGLLTIVASFVILYFIPDKKDFHKVGCKLEEINEKAILHCGGCGVKISDRESEYCPECGFENFDYFKYCPECGLKLSELEPKKKKL